MKLTSKTNVFYMQKTKKNLGIQIKEILMKIYNRFEE